MGLDPCTGPVGSDVLRLDNAKRQLLKLVRAVQYKQTDFRGMLSDIKRRRPAGRDKGAVMEVDPVRCST